jgi:cytoskeletal protein CcmA (bactofilin family)
MANIGKSITIRGDLTGNEDLVIEGDVEGKVELPNNELTIGANGKVRADVQAKAVIVVGRVSGNVSATDRVEIQASGVVDGDVHAPRLVVQEGAVINGGVSMGEKKPVASGLAKPLPRVAAGGELP